MPFKNTRGRLKRLFKRNSTPATSSNPTSQHPAPVAPTGYDAQRAQLTPWTSHTPSGTSQGSDMGAHRDDQSTYDAQRSQRTPWSRHTPTGSTSHGAPLGTHRTAAPSDDALTDSEDSVADGLSSDLDQSGSAQDGLDVVGDDLNSASGPGEEASPLTGPLSPDRLQSFIQYVHCSMEGGLDDEEMSLEEALEDNAFPSEEAKAQVREAFKSGVAAQILDALSFDPDGGDSEQEALDEAAQEVPEGPLSPDRLQSFIQYVHCSMEGGLDDEEMSLEEALEDNVFPSEEAKAQVRKAFENGMAAQIIDALSFDPDSGDSDLDEDDNEQKAPEGPLSPEKLRALIMYIEGDMDEDMGEGLTLDEAIVARGLSPEEEAQFRRAWKHEATSDADAGEAKSESAPKDPNQLTDEQYEKLYESLHSEWQMAPRSVSFRAVLVKKSIEPGLADRLLRTFCDETGVEHPDDAVARQDKQVEEMMAFREQRRGNRAAMGGLKTSSNADQLGQMKLGAYMDAMRNSSSVRGTLDLGEIEGMKRFGDWALLPMIDMYHRVDSGDIDVGGTTFKTEYFHPKGMIQSRVPVFTGGANNVARGEERLGGTAQHDTRDQFLLELVGGRFVQKESQTPVDTDTGGTMTRQATLTRLAALAQDLGQQGKSTDEIAQAKKDAFQEMKTEHKRFIYVMTDDGQFFAAPTINFIRHHSSFMAGGAVACAGDMAIENGELKLISNASGHYQPSPYFLWQALKELQSQGVNLASVTVEVFGLFSRINAMEFLSVFDPMKDPKLVQGQHALQFLDQYLKGKDNNGAQTATGSTSTT